VYLYKQAFPTKTVAFESGSTFVAYQNFHVPHLNEGLFHLFQAHRPWRCLESVPSQQPGVVGFGLCIAKEVLEESK
jgi:hypothetical protein